MEKPTVTLADVLYDFLTDQNNRLKQSTFKDYADVINVFELFLEGYGHLHVDKSDADRFEDAYVRDDADSNIFIKMFGPDQLSAGMYAEFFEYFLMRKVVSSVSYVKKSIRVMKKLTKWLYEHQYIDETQHSDLSAYFDEERGDSLVNAEKATELIFELTRQTPDRAYEDFLDDHFIIDEIETGNLWVRSFIDIDEPVGPVVVGDAIANLCMEEWEINMEIGKYNGKWYILESGSVVPV